jgi:hypothetical protein
MVEKKNDRKEYQQTYYKYNKEKRREYFKKYYEENQERIKARNKARYSDDKVKKTKKRVIRNISILRKNKSSNV